MSTAQFSIIKSMKLKNLILLPLFIREDLGARYKFLQQFNKNE
jgi:hypothetical protein